MLVMGSMIGSGIFIVSAEIAREVDSPALLIGAWVVAGFMTIVAALSYGELAAMMPRAGGQYVYLREALGPLWGFLYGWTLFLVIQTGTIAAVSVGFARYLGVLWPRISESNYIVAPIRLGSGYAISLSTAQLVGVLMIALLTWMNTRGLKLVTLPFEKIQTVPGDRVASATADVIFPGHGAVIMAVAIMVSTFGCNNGLILAGARAYYAMARDGLFFESAGRLNRNAVPAWGLL